MNMFILFTKEILQVTVISFMALPFIYRSLICIYIYLYLTLFIVGNNFLFSYWFMMLCLEIIYVAIYNWNITETGLNRLAEEKITELEGLYEEIIQNAQDREKNRKRNYETWILK